ncbi:MAG: AAA family ATPase [Gemmiger sp.]|uniref:AAA family ATPase n=1 Tax=Gemmiger sp. TaxID=2049027 RepID=UPI002E7A472A|nr:AAA family ATPase [Gemmiger sp.]MEE0799759.1 AAA family ATPase [Gemmiger sp.]
MKKLILVTSPPACGKTFISKQLAKSLDHVVYLDKDTLIPLSKQIFAVAHQPYDRSSIFFEKYIRDLEYRVVLDLAMEALEYDDIVLINAPFTREIRDLPYINTLRGELKKKGAELVVIWVDTKPEICHQRMIDRASDRDMWKLNHWDEYILGVNFEAPTNLRLPDQPDSLLIFHNSSQEEFETSMKEIVAQLEAAVADRPEPIRTQY